jgi:hypothetical protein
VGLLLPSAGFVCSVAVEEQESRSGIEGKDGAMSRRCSHTHQRLRLEAFAVQEQPLPCLAFAVDPASGGPRYALGHTLDDLWKPGVRVYLHLLTSGWVYGEQLRAVCG